MRWFRRKTNAEVAPPADLTEMASDVSQLSGKDLNTYIDRLSAYEAGSDDDMALNTWAILMTNAMNEKRGRDAKHGAVVLFVVASLTLYATLKLL